MLAGAACSASDPGDIPYRQAPPRPKPTSPVGTVTATGDGGGGADDGGVFGNTGPYQQGTAKLSSTQPKHADQDAAPALQGSQNPAGHSCVEECHSAGKPAATKPYAAGGTVYTDNGSNAPVGAGVEVRIRNPDGKAISVYTDENGNFFIPAADFTIQDLAHSGIRNATDTQLMGTTLSAATGGQCATGSGCHAKGGLGGPLRTKF